MNAAQFDILIIGGGVFGMTAAVELAARKHKVGLINPGRIPHHLAASTDVTKAVRMEYGADREYFQMAEISIRRWKEWNDFFGEQLYHEVGFLMLCKDSMESKHHQFERSSFQNLLQAGYAPEKLDGRELQKRFPAINHQAYPCAGFNATAGYAESGRAIERLARYARSLGVVIMEGQTATGLVVEKGRLTQVKTREGQSFSCGQVLVAAGAHTPYLLPELQAYMQPTGHPVFWLKPEYPELFSFPRLGVFTADISNTGWYGFPYLPEYGVVKIGKHARGLVLHPDQDDRRVGDDEVTDLRDFLGEAFPALAKAPLVYTRRCLYTDTLDGHFWIDRHPEIEGLSISTGGSGHAFKMAPILGEMTADMIEGKEHRFSARYRWRHLTAGTIQQEEARNVSR